jgi:CBS domain-containing protein
VTVGKICERRVATLPAVATVLAAAKTMYNSGERLLVVTDEHAGNRAAVGVVTDHELVSVMAEEGDPSRLTLKDIMCPNPGFVTEGDDVLDTLCWMRRNHLRDVIVHNQAGELLGILSVDRLVENLASELDDVESCAQEESPAHPRHPLH